MFRKILLIDTAQDIPKGMSGYGVRFERQRDYFVSLSQVEKEQYQDAILQLCLSTDVQEANLGLYTAVELRDVFLNGWVEEIRKVIESLIRHPITPQYENTASYALFRAIFTYGNDTVLPFLTGYLHKITRNLKKQALSRSDWLLFYPLICQILIKLSPVEFWMEFNVYREDKKLLAIVGQNSKHLISLYAGTGAQLYGVEWLEELTQRCAQTQSISFKSFAYQALKETASRIEAKNDRVVFLELLKKQLGDHFDEHV